MRTLAFSFLCSLLALAAAPSIAHADGPSSAPAAPAPPAVPSSIGAPVAPAPPAVPSAMGAPTAPAAPSMIVVPATPVPPVAPLAMGAHAPVAPMPPAAPVAPGSPGSAPQPPTPPMAPAFVFHPDPTVQIFTGPPRVRLGTRVTSMTPELREFFGAPKDAGLLVQEIEADSVAAKAGVKVGDVLVAVGGESIEDVSDVRRALAAKAGSEVEVEVVRKKKRKTLKATLPEQKTSTFVMPEGVQIPQMPQIVVPPEALEQLPPETRAQVERELEQARRQLREVQRELERLERSSHGHHDDADSGKRKRKRRVKRARRRGSASTVE